MLDETELALPPNAGAGAGDPAPSVLPPRSACRVDDAPPYSACMRCSSACMATMRLLVFATFSSSEAFSDSSASTLTCAGFMWMVHER